MPSIGLFIQHTKYRRLLRLIRCARAAARGWIDRKGCEKWRTPIDFIQTGDEGSIIPTGAPVLNVKVMPILHIVLDPRVYSVTNAERAEINDRLRCAVHI